MEARETKVETAAIYKTTTVKKPSTVVCRNRTPMKRGCRGKTQGDE
jgi:hypothetical protein